MRVDGCLPRSAAQTRSLRTSSSHHFSLERELNVVEKLLSPRCKKPLSG